MTNYHSKQLLDSTIIRLGFMWFVQKMETPSHASLAPNLGVAFEMDFEVDFYQVGIKTD